VNAWRTVWAWLVDLVLVAAATLCAGLAVGQEPRFLAYHPAGAVDGQGILADVTSRLSHTRREQSYEQDPVGWAHEGTHFLNVQLDDWMGPDNPAKEEHCAYVGGGRFVCLRHPRVTLEAVRRYVDPHMQAAWDSALCSWRQYNTEPLYLLDEWTAYANGSQACRELRADASRTRGSDERARWLGHFCDALVAAVGAYDRGYPQRSELSAFVRWHHGRVARILGLAAATQLAQTSAAPAAPATRCQWIWDGRQWARVCETRPVQLPPPPPALQSAPKSPPAATSAQAERDAQGWTAASATQPPPNHLVAPVYVVPMYGRDWHEDVAARVAKLEAQPTTITTPVTAPAATTSNETKTAPATPTNTPATRRPSAWEFAAQTLLVATGSGVVLGGTYGAWRLAAWGCGTLLRRAVQRQLSDREPTQPAAGPGGPATDKHFRGRPGRGGGT